MVTVPGALRKGSEKLVSPNGTKMGASSVMKNTTPSRRMSKWQFGGCSEEQGAVDHLVESAMRYAEPYALGFGFVRC